jgi:hypothetical protein
MKKVTAVVSAALFAANAYADPCGMVPPVWEGQGPPIQRVGPQKTYVFYKDGVETFVIRPGFSGNVDNFGMLIPFPSVPSIRKVPDQTFAHIAAAVDPPEVVVDLRPREYEKYATRAVAESADADDGGALGYGEVRVLKKEAVGMYEIAVLEAGSPAALGRWMDDHGYTYPKGMDRAVNDYVKEKWCFVAVKTRVGAKGQVDPKPGMRDANAKLPAGSSFDGHVQAMGFRFKVDKPVVPMRLSTFNDGELRNIVYVLHEDAVRLEGIPKGHVKRQLKGKVALDNVTELLPLRIYGGKLKDVGDAQLENLKASRNPVPHNGVARDLFASDLLAAGSGKLAHDHEEREKQLLNINERLNLRGPNIDGVLAEELKKDREASVLGSLPELKSMTLTVVDGDFPREFLAENNITFDKWKMPAHLNARSAYLARSMAPEGKLGGVRVEANGDQTDQRDNPLLKFWKDLWD